MQRQADKKDSRVIDLREYRRGKAQARQVEEAAPDSQEDILTTVSYYLLMAARTIAQQRKH